LFPKDASTTTPGNRCGMHVVPINSSRMSVGNRDDRVRGNQLSIRASGYPPVQLFPNCANVRSLRVTPRYVPLKRHPPITIPSPAERKLCANLRWRKPRQLLASRVHGNAVFGNALRSITCLSEARSGSVVTKTHAASLSLGLRSIMLYMSNFPHTSCFS